MNTETQKTVEEILNEREYRDEQGNWYPACGGTEESFTSRSGKKLLYCWQPSTGKHAYLDCDSDIILDDEEAAIFMMMV